MTTDNQHMNLSRGERQVEAVMDAIAGCSWDSSAWEDAELRETALAAIAAADRFPREGWFCKCGSLNRGDEAYCYRCGGATPR